MKPVKKSGNVLIRPRNVLLTAVMLASAWLSANTAEAALPAVADLRCEFMRTPLGLDDRQPALSWVALDERRDVMQSAYRILVASSEALLAQDKGDLWDSGEVTSDQSHLVVYGGKPLVSRQRCFWKVQVKSRSGDTEQVSSWSQPSWWEMGLLERADWKGSWIESSECKPVENEWTKQWAFFGLVPQEHNRSEFKHEEKAAAARKEGENMLGAVIPAPCFRTEFDVPGQVARARLYLCGQGFSESFVNGAPVSDRLFDPSITRFEKRGGYVTHDVTALVRPGKNHLAALVGSGLFHEELIWGSPKEVFGKPRLIAQLEVELEDGRRIIVASNKEWKTAVGPIIKSQYYAGEVYDARRATGWKVGQGSDVHWVAATEVKPDILLQAQRCDPERVIRRVKPVAVTEPRAGIFVFDLGEMIVGSPELHIKAAAGTPVIMRTAEFVWTPEKQGNNFKASLIRYAEFENTKFIPGMIASRARGGTYLSHSFHPKGLPKSKVHLGLPTFIYVTDGNAAGETYRPSFTVTTFRYIEVQGLKEKPSLDTITGLVINNDHEVIGEFKSGNPDFNDIFEACMNSTRYNTHGMSWDNAVERQQSQVYNGWSAPFASYILHYPNLWRKIMEDQRLVNELDRSKGLNFASAVYGYRWGKIAAKFPVQQGTTTEIPVALYDRYGDPRELAAQYPHMKAFCEAFFPNGDGKLIKGAAMAAWNDHFCKEAAADCQWDAEFDEEYFLMMIMYRNTRDTADYARILGKEKDAKSLEELAEKIRTAINANYYNADTKTYGAAKKKKSNEIDDSTGWHGIMAVALAYGIVPEADRQAVIDNCIKDMKLHYKGHHAAGHITHQLLYDVYSDHGLIETCYDMMNATGYPSFRWMLQSGNRTIPEGPTMENELPAKASACQNECQEPARWFTQSLCGIMPDRAAPAFKHTLLRPRIPSKLPSASLVTTTAYGTLESSWVQEKGVVTWTVRIPANSYATALIPATASQIFDGTTPLAKTPGCRIQMEDASGVECRLGSGTYSFRFPSPKNEPSRLSELK